MLKSAFNNWSGPQDQATPKASASDKNPFDTMANPAVARSGTASPSLASTAKLASSPAVSRKNSAVHVPGTPTGKTFSLPFFSGSSDRLASMSHASTSQDSTMGGSTASGMATPGPSSLVSSATTSLSTAEPDFSLAQPPRSKLQERVVQQESKPASAQSSFSNGSQASATGSSGSGSSRQPKGKLSVKMIQARNLACTSAAARPYVVATYDQNEFVGREPITEADAPVTSYATRRNSTTNATTGATGNLAIAGTAQGSVTPMGKTPPNSNLSSSSAQSALAKSLEAHRISEAKHEAGGSPRRTTSAYDPVWKQEVIFDVVSEQPSQITISIYDRAHDEGFLGAIDVSPRLSTSQAIDTWVKLQPRADENVSGEIRIQYHYERSDSRRSLNVKDFDFLRMIGKGTFGRVFQVRKKDTRRIYAMKVLSKREIVAKKEVAHTIGERKILQRSSECPFLLGLKFSFQSETELYLVMDYKSGGELFHHLQQEGRFTEDRARFYTSEIVLAFEHLHKFDIVYRDLKPENILLDATGHIVLCDFGLSKPDLPSDALTNTFCGTTEYLAPEVLLDDHGYSKLVDFWSLGVLLFEMCCGWSPFYAEDTQQMYKNICFGKIKFPRGVIGDDGKQFVKGLLNRNPRHRLGAQRDAAELKDHPFFSAVDWVALASRKVVPPFTPFVDSDESVANFDAEFTEADVHKEAPAAVFEESDRSDDWIAASSIGGVPIQGRSRRGDIASSLSGSVQDAFRGFSYAGSSVDDRPSWSHFSSAKTPEYAVDSGSGSGGSGGSRDRDEDMS